LEAGGQFRLFLLSKRLPSDGLKKCSRCRDKDEYVGSNRHKFLPLLRVRTGWCKTIMRREGASRHSHRLSYIASITHRSDSIDRSPEGHDSTDTRNTLASGLQSRTPSCAASREGPDELIPCVREVCQRHPCTHHTPSCPTHHWGSALHRIESVSGVSKARMDLLCLLALLL
jgi:hypothetical protein